MVSYTNINKGVLTISLRLSDRKIDLNIPEILAETDDKKTLMNYSLLLSIQRVLSGRRNLEYSTVKLSLDSIINVISSKIKDLLYGKDQQVS